MLTLHIKNVNLISVVKSWINKGGMYYEKNCFIISGAVHGCKHDDRLWKYKRGSCF